MTAVQNHGLVFEQWVRDNFFEGYEGDNTQRWDIPAEINQPPRSRFPQSHLLLPVSVKSCKENSAINLGDAVRQRSTTEPFLLLVGFWVQTSAEFKTFTHIDVALMDPATWNGLWGNASLDLVTELSDLVRDTSPSIKQARARAREWKARHSEILGTSAISLNPKINKDQRRLQCSLKRVVFLAHCVPSAHLFGRHLTPNPMASTARDSDED